MQILQPSVVVRARRAGPAQPRDQPGRRPEADPPEDPAAELPRLSRQDHAGRLAGDARQRRRRPGDRRAVERRPADAPFHADVRFGRAESQEVLCAQRHLPLPGQCLN